MQKLVKEWKDIEEGKEGKKTKLERKKNNKSHTKRRQMKAPGEREKKKWSQGLVSWHRSLFCRESERENQKNSNEKKKNKLYKW